MRTTQNSALKDNNNPDRFNLHGGNRRKYQSRNLYNQRGLYGSIQENNTPTQICLKQVHGSMDHFLWGIRLCSDACTDTDSTKQNWSADSIFRAVQLSTTQETIQARENETKSLKPNSSNQYYPRPNISTQGGSVDNQTGEVETCKC